MSRHGIHAPSHWTLKMLRVYTGLSRQALWDATRKGKPLEAETHHGQLLVPAWRVMAWLEARGK